MPHSRHKRRKRSDDRHETGQDDGLTAVAFVEAMGLIQVAAAENFRIGITEELFAKQPANRVVQGIANNRGNDHQQHH